jgi:Ca-activated chloride channel family protein
LSAADRFALVTYSDGVRIDSNLQNVTPDNRRNMEHAVSRVKVGGGTNLGAGLQAGIDLLESSLESSNTARIILISDGLANKGITDARTLGSMAGVAVEREFAVSTVGVGIEFNEYLMSAIADQGTGSYYYLENPQAFAEVFQKEFIATRSSFVSNLKIKVPSETAIDLVDAAGYPIRIEDGYAVFHPGSLRPGQSRKIYLTLRVPTRVQGDFELGGIKVGYQHDNAVYETTLANSYQIACVADRRKVLLSIDKSGWAEKVINEDFNRLKQEVAAELKSGEKKEALKRIRTYRSEKQEMNNYVQSTGVARNLDTDLKELETFVEDTFTGAPEAVRQKQKSNSKALQYDGYRSRRQ